MNQSALRAPSGIVLRLFLFLVVVTLAACQSSRQEGLYAELQTDKGTITISLEYERVPMTVANFVGLVEGTIEYQNRDSRRFYDGLTFHRVIADFMVQGGDPAGNGSGGPGYQFPNEIHPDLKHDGPGVLSMANSGPGTNGSQFFITHVATPWLDGLHTVFGHVVSGQEVVDSVQQGDLLQRVTVRRVGDKAKAFVADQQSFDALVATAQQRRSELARLGQQRDFEQIAAEFPQAVQDPSGLRYVIQEAGVGSPPPEGAVLQVHYVGRFLDGEVFDSSYVNNSPIQVQLGQVIEGWNITLRQMVRGEKRTIIVPPELGYGERGHPTGIPPNAFLIFEMYLVDF